MAGLFRIRTIAGLVVFALLPGACSKKQEPPRNVLLIIVDTLRVDKLGCYGSDLGATPRIDRLAKAGVLFEKAYSHAPWTLPACASILTFLQGVESAVELLELSFAEELAQLHRLRLPALGSSAVRGQRRRPEQHE